MLFRINFLNWLVISDISINCIAILTKLMSAGDANTFRFPYTIRLFSEFIYLSSESTDRLL